MLSGSEVCSSMQIDGIEMVTLVWNTTREPASAVLTKKISGHCVALAIVKNAQTTINWAALVNKMLDMSYQGSNIHGKPYRPRCRNLLGVKKLAGSGR